MHQSLFDFESTESIQHLHLCDADVHYVPQFISTELTQEYLQQLSTSLKWRQDNIRIYGRDVLIPRLQAWYGDPEARYTYSGLAMTPLPWTPLLKQLRQQCEQYCQHSFNSVLANFYRDGNDSMGMHSDDEPELGAKPTIASLTLGEVRTFKLKHKRTGELVNLPLESGSLLVMKGNTQQHWQHGISKTKRVIGPRLNLTFRYIFQC